MNSSQSANKAPRRKIANVSVYGTAQLHLRNPYIVAFWSAMFPGMGHFLLSRYLRGYVLFLWEIIVNVMSHVNMALLYTFLGSFEEAKTVIDIRWSLLYIPTYAFAVWDSYRSAVDLNKHYLLARREDTAIDVFAMNALGIHTLDKAPPYVPCSWCLLTPGLGQLMLHRFISGFFIIIFWIVIIYQSKVLPAINLTALGQFDGAKTVLNPQWFLNIPSVYFFCAYATYVATVEQNKLFDWEQKRFLRENFQSTAFPFPNNFTERASGDMYVLSVFNHSVNVEMAVTSLTEAGIAQQNIMASAVEKELSDGKFFDTMHSFNTKSQFDLPMMLGVLLALLGCIYGFVLRWGPVIWGVIGGAAGFAIGLLTKLMRFNKQKTNRIESEVVILVSCEGGKTEEVKKLLRENGALGISEIKAGAG
jgi:hypothetical protein